MEANATASSTLRKRGHSAETDAARPDATLRTAGAAGRAPAASAAMSSTEKATSSSSSPGSAGAGSLFLLYASLAGTCGALSAVVGKLAVAAALAPRIAAAAVSWAASHGLVGHLLPLLTVLPVTGAQGERSHNDHARVEGQEEKEAAARLTFCVEMVFRVAFFVANAILTGQMWRFFLKSLSLGPTPVSQIINTGTSFAVSALLGLVFFHEEVSAMWGVGAFLVVLGLALVVTDPQAAKVTS